MTNDHARELVQRTAEAVARVLESKEDALNKMSDGITGFAVLDALDGLMDPKNELLITSKMEALVEQIVRQHPEIEQRFREWEQAHAHELARVSEEKNELKMELKAELLASAAPILIDEFLSALIDRAAEVQDATTKATHREACGYAWKFMRAIVAMEDPNQLHFDLARKVLKDESIEDEMRARDMLARELVEQIRRLQAALKMDKEPPATSDDWFPPQLNEILWLDELGARFLESFGKTGREAAKVLREASRARWITETAHVPMNGIARPALPLWRLWADTDNELGPIRFITSALAKVLWKDVVEPRWRAQREKPPALPLALFPEIHRTMLQPGRQVRGTSAGAEIVDSSGARITDLVPALPLPLADMQRGVTQLASLSGQRVFRWLVVQIHHAKLAGSGNPGLVLVEGGIAALAERVGATSNKARSELLDVLQAGQYFHHRWPGGIIGGLWTFALKPAAPGRRAHLGIQASPILLPHYAMRSLGRDQQLLVPVLPMPPFVGRLNDHAAQAALQLHVAAKLVEHRLELVQEGGALITDSAFDTMADAVGLPRSLRGAVIERWTHDDADGPAVLERVGPNRFHLANNPTYRDARAFLEGGAKRSIRAAQNARRGIQAKRRHR